MAVAGAVTVSASVPACPPMPTSAASTEWPSTGAPHVSAVSVQSPEGESGALCGGDHHSV